MGQTSYWDSLHSTDTLSEENEGSMTIRARLGYWKEQGVRLDSERVDAAAIQKQLYSRKARGIFAFDLVKYLKSSGFQVFSMDGSWRDLQEHLRQGRPLIVSLQPGSSSAPLHYVVVAGIDWQHEAVFIHDPARGKLLRLERALFERQWRSSRNWMVLAVPEKAS